MMYRKATVGMIGACILWGALSGAALANEFYATGTAKEIEGADNLGKTIVHYLTVLGLPLLSVGLGTAGVIKLRERPGQATGAFAGSAIAGYLSPITRSLHSDAAAAVALSTLPGALSWGAFIVGLLLQAALVALLVCYVRRRFPCGRNAGVSLTSR